MDFKNILKVEVLDILTVLNFNLDLVIIINARFLQWKFHIYKTMQYLKLENVMDIYS